jgi:hypothetical protein
MTGFLMEKPGKKIGGNMQPGIETERDKTQLEF